MDARMSSAAVRPGYFWQRIWVSKGPSLRSECPCRQVGAVIEEGCHYPRPVITHKARKRDLGRRHQDRVAVPDLLDLCCGRHEVVIISGQLEAANFATLGGESIGVGEPNPHGSRLSRGLQELGRAVFN